MDGILNIDKPLGWTSHDVVAKIRRLLPRGTKVGHGGTLDPEASGVLPILVGRATRLFDVLLEKDKEYLAVLQLGTETDTQDATGTVIDTQPVTAKESDVRCVLPRFTGEILQTPPLYSAIKVDGKRLYQMAREGKAEDVQVQPRPVQIHALTLEADLGEDAYLLRVCCGRGTYIRTLCRDIAQALGTCGHMRELSRTRCGRLTKEGALVLEALIENPPNWAETLQPMDSVLDHLPRLDAPPAYLQAIRNGNKLPKEAFDAHWGSSGVQRLYCEDRLCALGLCEEEHFRIAALLIESASEVAHAGY